MLPIKTIHQVSITLLLAVVVLGSCKKDVISGAVQDVNAYKNTTTYDVLKSNTKYDTLVRIIDTAGYKDIINTVGITFFAPTNTAIYNYLNARTLALQVTNRNAQFGLDSLFYYLRNNINGTRDSLGMYIIPQSLPYSALTNTGAKYPTKLAGDTAVVSFEFVTSGYNSNVSSTPQVVYFTQLWKPYTLNDANPAGKIPGTIGVHTLCTTSGINTQNAVMNALTYNHILFFYGTKQ
ncbi:MAG: fasciclin domain-containing protein [Bacteroidota bacterium]